TSRRGLNSPGAVELETELRELGVRVTVAACDVADRDALTHLIRQLKAEGASIRAVVHAAGAGKPSALAETSLADVADIVAGKVAGAIHLHDLLSQDALDAFVLFSSGAGIWGSGGQGAYAGANAFLDALAEHRRGRHLPATSLAWGAWDGEGMADDPMVADQLSGYGIPMMAPELAIAALQQALQQNETCLAVADIEWDLFASTFTAMRPSPLLQEIPDVQQHLKKTDTEISPQSDPADRSLLRQRLAGLPEVEQDRVLLDLVRTHAAAVLGYESSYEVDSGRGFLDLGFSSLTAVELRNRLNTATGLHLPPTLIFDYPTPTTLVGLLRGELLGPQGEEIDRLLAALVEVENGLSGIVASDDFRTRIKARLQLLLERLNSVGDRVVRELDSVTDDELFQIIDRDLNIQ
ncbi:beta-ketoacyl reductase, partial [Actinomadura chokoriensis]|uniref:beta-ketoacyl reductase n=1 Tax=Actinomadura chokoriensis TaxID=454156 RepID=UPI0035696CD6